MLACYIKFYGYMCIVHMNTAHQRSQACMTMYLFQVWLESCFLTDQRQPTCSIVRIWQAFGFTAGFATAEILSLEARLWLLLATVSFATLCSLVVEFKTQTKAQLLPCVSNGVTVDLGMLLVMRRINLLMHHLLHTVEDQAPLAHMWPQPVQIRLWLHWLISATTSLNDFKKTIPSIIYHHTLLLYSTSSKLARVYISDLHDPLLLHIHEVACP